MTAMLKSPEASRWLALFVLVFVILMVYFLFFQGFVSEHSLLNEEIADLEESRQNYTELASQIPEIRKRIKQVKENVGDNSSFLVADSYNLGTSELTRIMKGIVTGVTSTRSECDIVSSTPYKDRDPDQFEKIILKVRMRCHFDKMVQVLLDVEKHEPKLFIDNLTLEQRVTRRYRRNQKPTKPMTEVRFDLYAYMNKPIKKKKENAKK